jgi:hypothetical protein
MAFLALFTTGCEDDDYDHIPPLGFGTLIIDNDTSDDIEIYLDGTRMREVKDYDDRYTDLEPGVYRLVLADEDGDRSFRDEIDILANRLTIVHVDEGSLWGEYSVWVEFQD